MSASHIVCSINMMYGVLRNILSTHFLYTYYTPLDLTHNLQISMLSQQYRSSKVFVHYGLPIIWRASVCACRAVSRAFLPSTIYYSRPWRGVATPVVASM
jgi:uncharacterized membrane protein